MKIKSKFFPLGIWCHLLMQFETQTTAKKRVFINFALCTIFFTFFKNLSIQKLLWVVAMMVSSQFKTTKPYFWHIQLILYTLRWLCLWPCFDIFYHWFYHSFRKKNREINSQKCPSLVVGGLNGAHGKLASCFTNVASYFWTGWELRRTRFFSNPKISNCGKIGKNEFPSKHHANKMLHTYTQLIVLKTRFPSHTLLTQERILILSSLAQKLQLKQG